MPSPTGGGKFGYQELLVVAIALVIFATRNDNISMLNFFYFYSTEDTDGEKPVSDGANAGPKEVPKQSSQPASADNEEEEEEADATVEVQVD